MRKQSCRPCPSPEEHPEIIREIPNMRVQCRSIVYVVHVHIAYPWSLIKNWHFFCPDKVFTKTSQSLKEERQLMLPGSVLSLVL